jgi:hypothetical protein
MSKDGVVPPQGGPSRRPGGGPEHNSGNSRPGGPAARRYGTLGLPASQSPAQSLDPHDGEELGAPCRWHAEDDTISLAAGETDALRSALREGRLSAAELDLARALRTRVAVLGAGGPPDGGLTSIRRKARARQRNRMVLAGSAGVLFLAMAVTLATGDRFDLVPTLTNAVGLGGGSGLGGTSGGSTAQASTAGNGGRPVWPTGSGGSAGLAIGPVSPMLTTPSAAAAAKVPLCTADTLKATTTLGPTVNSVEYGHVDAVAQSPCVVVGPPVLTVANEAGTAGSSVVILKEDRTAAALLPNVPSWGATMVLKAGQAYQFQFAWSSLGCPLASASPPLSPSPAANSTYYLGYAVTGTTPTAVVTLTANCGAQVYVTDIYAPGAFPLPKASGASPASSASPAGAPTSPAPPPSTAASTPPPASPSEPPVSSSAAPNPGSGSGSGSGDTGGGSGTGAGSISSPS